uniref:Arabidopsis retrotransposon Orf1 C-terminal domain-containing protein n=1 Tax=Oryza sativa subsp. japonica TaxID=39947 RepID=Q2QPS1_ORYSJ|nr:hypothetical protein LOC_Os12g33500 [Oryza sativa Japonica Group]
MKRRLSRLFKESGSSSSHHDESSTRSSADIVMEDAKVPPQLLNHADLDLVGDRERQAYYMLADREYAHTREYSPELIKKIGMDTEFRAIWKAVGWQKFAMVDEPGSRLLTLQFLCTLKEIEDGISFRFFHEEFTLTWKGLSTLLGFHDTCKIDLQKGISGFEKNRFWEDISGAPICKKPRTNDIHNPTLRLMHKWIAMTLFPRGDLRPIRGDELIIMFAMVRKIKIAPVKCMIRQCCTNEIPLPIAGYHLYNYRELTIPLQTIEESRAGGTYRETRNMTRNEQESSSSSTPVQMYEGGEWRSSSSRWDLGKITRRMDTFDMQTGEIQYNLSEHMAQTQEWQQSADAQFANFNNMMQQQHDGLQAYFRFQGFNPHPGP